MDNLSDEWLSEIAMNDDGDDYNIFQQYQIMDNFFDDFNTIQESCMAPIMQQQGAGEEKNLIIDEQQVTINLRSSSSSSSQTLSPSFDSPPIKDPQPFYGGIKPGDQTVYNGKLNFESFFNKKVVANAPKLASQGTKRDHSKTVSSIRTPAHAQDHIMSERRRREKLNQRFIALSAMVPGLKKMDKASVLGDAIKYLKQLQERVSLLEEQAKKRSVESAAAYMNEESLPEIEAKVSDKNVLIRVHCERNKGAISRVMSEIEKLHLSVVSSSSLPFGNHATDITVVAQMENEFSMTVKELVKNLRSALLKFM